MGWSSTTFDVALLIAFLDQLINRFPNPFLNLSLVFWLYDLSFFDSVDEIQFDYLVLSSLHKNKLVLIDVLRTDLQVSLFICFAKSRFQGIFTFVNLTLWEHHVANSFVSIALLFVKDTE